MHWFLLQTTDKPPLRNTTSSTTITHIHRHHSYPRTTRLKDLSICTIKRGRTKAYRCSGERVGEQSDDAEVDTETPTTKTPFQILRHRIDLLLQSIYYVQLCTMPFCYVSRTPLIPKYYNHKQLSIIDFIG